MSSPDHWEKRAEIFRHHGFFRFLLCAAFPFSRSKSEAEDDHHAPSSLLFWISGSIGERVDHECTLSKENPLVRCHGDRWFDVTVARRWGLLGVHCPQHLASERSAADDDALSFSRSFTHSTLAARASRTALHATLGDT